jgi:hypothetical protein
MPKEREEGTLASMREVPSFVLLFRSWFLEPECFLGEIERLSTCMRVRESCLGAVSMHLQVTLKQKTSQDLARARPLLLSLVDCQ